jgi:pimeloyl-ACP methyl ester carboxylesterase
MWSVPKNRLLKLRRLSACCLLALLCLLANGVASAARSETHAYLLRGIFNVSVGLDVLAGKLAKRGIAASVYGPLDENSVTDAAIRDYRSGKARSIVLIGHSLGAGAAVSVASRLAQAGVPVALLVLLDPKASFWVPRNVSRAVNFYIPQSGAAVAAGSGFRGSLTNISVGGVPGMDHMTIQSLDSMHQRIIGYVR